jgi:hypothetical protein
VTHQLAYLLCEVNEIYKSHDSVKAKIIDNSSFDNALDEYLQEHSDTLKAIYEQSTRIINPRMHENPKEILSAILSTNKESVTIQEIINEMKKKSSTYRGNNLKKYLDELTMPDRCEILRYNKESMSYYFSNPFVKAYLQCVLRNSDRQILIVNHDEFFNDFKSSLTQELGKARDAFLKDYYSDESEIPLDFEEYDDEY